jgi:hypothetical protein
MTVWAGSGQPLILFTFPSLAIWGGHAGPPLQVRPLPIQITRDDLLDGIRNAVPCLGVFYVYRPALRILQDIRRNPVGCPRAPHDVFVIIPLPEFSPHHRPPIYDGVGSVKGHLQLANGERFFLFLLKRIFFFLLTKARS